MRSLDDEWLSQLYLELVDAYKERFMPQNGQVVVLKCPPIWKKVNKSFKTLSELKLNFIPKAGKQEAVVHKTHLEGCFLEIEILIRLLLFFIYTWQFGLVT